MERSGRRRNRRESFRESNEEPAPLFSKSRNAEHLLIESVALPSSENPTALQHPARATQTSTVRQRTARSEQKKRGASMSDSELLPGWNKSEIGNPQENMADDSSVSSSQESLFGDEREEGGSDTTDDKTNSQLWTGSLETRSLKNSGKARSDSFLCGMTPLNTPYTPASLVKFMRAARSQRDHPGESMDISSRRRKKKRADRHAVSSPQDNLIGTLMMLLGYLLSSVRDISDAMMHTLLPGIITRHHAFVSIRPWILNFIMICTLCGVLAVGAPVAIVICFLTAPLWIFAAAAYVGYRIIEKYSRKSSLRHRA